MPQHRSIMQLPLTQRGELLARFVEVRSHSVSLTATLSAEDQSELERLVAAEVDATTARASRMADESAQ